MSAPQYELLRGFRALFEGVVYKHRDATLGNRVARALYEDLYQLGRSEKLRRRIDARSRVVSTADKVIGVKSRRGDASFGELVPVATASMEGSFLVARGPVATLEIAAEAKILAKAMIKQIDRVIGDLTRQVEQFRLGGSTPICVGVVGVNHATRYVSFEGERSYPTTGVSAYRHPIQEANAAIERLAHLARPKFDEFVILKFIASNEPPFTFSWINEPETQLEYSALLTRVSREYDRRF